MKSRLVDSALLLAILSGIFFAAGTLVEIRRARDYGIDVGLMPDLRAEQVIFLGFRYATLFLLAYSIPAVVAAYVLSRRARPAAVARPGDRRRADVRTSVIAALGSLLAVVLLMVTILFLPSRWLSFTRPDAELSPVAALRLKDEPRKVDATGLRFFSQRDGWIIFKKPDGKGYLCLRSDEIASLELDRK